MKHLEANKADIISDYRKGLSYKKLSDHYHCSINTMIKHLKKWGEISQP